MEKFKVIDPAGFFFDGKKHPAGDVIPIPAGPRLEAALHFKQVELVKEKSDRTK